MVQKQYEFSRNHASNFEFGSFPGLAICGKMLSPHAGSISEPQSPVSHMITRINNRYTRNHSVFHFQCSIQ